MTAFAFFVALQLADCATTAVFGLTGEGNPAVHAAMLALGHWWIAAKLALVMPAAFWAFRRRMFVFLAIWDVVLAFVVIGNSLQIAELL